MNLDAAASFCLNPPLLVVQLGVLLVLLVLGRQFTADVRPIIIAVRDGVAVQAQSNAAAYAICLGFGLSASASAFIDVFKGMDAASIAAMSWHQYAVSWVKVANPFIVSCLAYATQNKFAAPPPGMKPVTAAPFNASQ